MKRGLLLLIILLPCVFAQDFIQEKDIPSSISPAERVALLSKPAVVQIRSTFKVAGFVPGVRINDDGSVEEIPPGFNNILVKNAGGSGFIIAPNGYVVTNAHIVRPAADDEISSFIEDSLNKMGVQGSDRKKIGDYLFNKVRITVEPVKVHVLLQVVGPTGKAQESLPADVVELGSAYPGKDVAVLKVSQNYLPTIGLSSLDLPIGASVFVMGYPEAAKISTVRDSSITAGVLSAYKQSEKGWKLPQMDAAISPGSSGAPVLDESSHVVGIATIQSSKAAGFNYFIPVEIIEEFLRKANVEPRRGVLDQLYEVAVVNFWNERYYSALSKLRHVLDIRPNHPTAVELLARSRIRISENEASDSYRTATLLFGGCVLVALCLLFYLFLKERQELKALEKKFKKR